MVFEKKTYTNQNSQAEIGYHLANFISIFVAPPTMAIVAIISFSLWSPIGLGLLYAPFNILFCFFCFVPFVSILYYYRKNVVDLYVSKRRMRTPFFLIVITSYSFGTIIFSVTNTKIMFLLALGYIIDSIILMVINLFWKVSVHCAGVTGPIFSLIFVFGINALPLSLIIGIVGWFRKKLKNHTFAQTLVGTLISLTVGFSIYSMLYI